MENERIQWDKVEWLIAVKSAMSGPLGIARVDFLTIRDQTAETGSICLNELMNPDGVHAETNLVRLSTIVQELADRQYGDDFEKFGHGAGAAPKPPST